MLDAGNQGQESFVSSDFDPRVVFLSGIDELQISAKEFRIIFSWQVLVELGPQDLDLIIICRIDRKYSDNLIFPDFVIQDQSECFVLLVAFLFQKDIKRGEFAVAFRIEIPGDMMPVYDQVLIV